MDVIIATAPGCFLVRLHQTMDVIMVGPWMLCAEDALGHGVIIAPHLDTLLSDCIRIRPWTISWLGHGCSGLRMRWTMVIIVDAMCSKCIAPWTLPLPPPPRPHTPPNPTPPKDALLSAETVDLITVGPWMRWGQNALDHGRHHGWLFSERNRLLRPCHCHGWAMDALFLPPQHSFQAPAPVSKRQFLIRVGF